MLRVTLIKYISKEIWSIFLTCLFVFLFIIMASQMLNMTELVVNYGAGFGGLFRLILCMIPQYMLIAMPAACLMAVLLSFIRMASDNEIIALHSSGISIYQLMPPVIIFSLICFLLAGFLALFWSPYGNRTYESVFIDLIKTRIESQIKEGVFMERGDYVFYVNSYSPKDKIMKDVFIVEKKKGKQRTIIAKKAKFVPQENQMFIQLMDYKAFEEDEKGRTKIAEIQSDDKFPVEIDSMMEISKGDKIVDPESMYINELLDLIKNSGGDIKEKNIAQLRLYEMFSVPLAIFIIGIVGAPLGSHIRAHGRTKGIIISLLLFLSYTILLLAVESLCESGKLNPVTGIWFPDLFLLILCIFFLLRSAGKLSLKFTKSVKLDIPPQRM